ncbi:MAG TPA: hypothetical protein VKV73_22390 [Chloroflexota bacterium]|nr:hypothetical protein [Chloroflexota bacterium]
MSLQLHPRVNDAATCERDGLLLRVLRGDRRAPLLRPWPVPGTSSAITWCCPNRKSPTQCTRDGLLFGPGFRQRMTPGEAGPLLVLQGALARAYGGDPSAYRLTALSIWALLHGAATLQAEFGESVGDTNSATPAWMPANASRLEPAGSSSSRWRRPRRRDWNPCRLGL